MSEHMIEESNINQTFFTMYQHDWGSLNYEQIQDLTDKFDFNEDQIAEYLEDISIRIKYEQQLLTSIKKNNKTNIDPKFMNMNADEPIFLPKPRLQRQLHWTCKNSQIREGLFFLCELLTEKKELRKMLQT